MINCCSPIGISTYKRIDHLKETLDALSKNILAEYSDLYIFSDAPRVGDEDEVYKLREFLNTINGFKSVSIFQRITNDRVKNNREGIKYLLDKYGKCIFLEEDIVTAPGFLQFMNDALAFHEKNKDIISITGYTPPINIDTNYKNDSFFLQRFNAWGFATWKDRFDKIEKYLNRNSVLKNLNNPTFLKKLCTNGVDIPQMLMLEIDGEIDALDVKIMYQQILHNWFTVHPKKSLVQNIGHDGTGLHCGVSNRFHHDELWDKIDGFKFNDNIIPNKDIVRANYEFRFSMNSFSKELIVSDLLNKIENLDNDSFSIWGIGELTQLLLDKLKLCNINKQVNYIIDSKAQNQKMSFYGYDVITVETAIKKNETNFVLASWNNKDILESILLQNIPNNNIDNATIIKPNIFTGLENK